MITEFHQATTIAGTAVFHHFHRENTSLHYRFVFVAQNELISEDWRDRFYQFIAGSVRALGGTLAAIGGTDETVELRIALKPTNAPDDFARRLKILSASWARRKANHPNFLWREDYQATTLAAPRRRRNAAIRRFRAHA